MHTWWKPTLKLDFRSFPRLVIWGVVLSSSAGHHRSLCSHSVTDHGGWGGNQDVFHAAELGCPLGERDSMHFYLRVFSI